MQVDKPELDTEPIVDAGQINKQKLLKDKGKDLDYTIKIS